MKTILAAGMAILVMTVAACSQQTMTSTNLSENAPASANTKSKIGVDIWAIKGTTTTVEVKGQTTAGKALRELKLTMNSDKSCSLVKNYMDASGNVVASLTLKLDKEGKALSNTPSGNPSDAALCPDCMSNDLKSSDPTVIPNAELSPQLTGNVLSPCQRAQRRIANAAATVVAQCFVSNPDPLGCAVAQAGYALAYQDFVDFCGNPFGFSVSAPSGTGQRLYSFTVGKRPRAG